MRHLKKINTLPAWVLTAMIIILDQLSKYLTRTYLQLGQSVDIWGSFLRFTHLQNTGAAFSLSLPNQGYNRIFFIGVSILATALIIYLLLKATYKLQVWAFGLVLGGALGNLIDRIIFGGVTDFADFDIPDMFGMQRFPVFNVADSAIFIGMLLLIIDMFFFSGRTKPQADTPADLAENPNGTEIDQSNIKFDNKEL